MSLKCLKMSLPKENGAINCVFGYHGESDFKEN